METRNDCAAAALLAARIRDARDDLTARWLERIAARMRIQPERVFPTEDLLDHVPVLMVGIADYLEDPADEITVDMPVLAKAIELGELRYAQGFDASEILKEYEILGGVLFSFSTRVAAELDASPADMMICGHRLFRAVSVIEQATAARYLAVLIERVGEREERLRRFSRMITHELKNRVGATLGAGQLLQEEWLGDEERRRFAGMVTDNAIAIQTVMENLVVLASIDRERRRERNIPLREVVREAFRQVRELARAREVELECGDDLPDVEVNAPAVEFCLANYLSNAIKYSDPSRRDRRARVTGELRTAGGEAAGRELVLSVTDNGLGVPEEQRGQLFERFFRAHTGVVEVEGTGLGLSLVREMVESLGGRAWAEFPDGGGAAFLISLPCRPLGEGGGFSCGGAGGGRGRRDSPAGEAPGTASGSLP
jgi:signal transduction histidine kinase